MDQFAQATDGSAAANSELASTTGPSTLKTCDKLAYALLDIVEKKSPTIRNVLKLKRTLDQIEGHVSHFKSLKIIEKETYVMEVLALADPTEAEDLSDVSYCAALVILEVMNCNDPSDRAPKKFRDREEQELLTQVSIGIQYVCEQLQKRI